MATGLLGVGVRALNIAQTGLATAQHNIANVNTPGFHRQEVVQATSLPYGTGAGWIGQGAQVDNVKRIYSEFLDRQVLSAGTQSAYFDAYYGQVRQIDNLLADPTAGLSPALQEFFSGIQGVASDPASVPARQSLLSNAQALVARFGSIYERFRDIRSGVNDQLKSVVSEINAYASQIAQINEKIVIAEATNQHPANDLRDQRERLVSDLNERVKTTVVTQSDGSFNVFIGNGQPLVVGATGFNLATVQNSEDPEALDVAYINAAGATTPIPQTDLTGGSLGGLLAFRREVLDKSQNELGRVAIGLAETVNVQHQLGQDLLGALGGVFFNIAGTSPTVSINTLNTGSAVISGTLNATNAGAAALTGSNYRLTYVAATTSYLVEDLVNNTSTTVAAASLSTAVPGLTLSIASGPPANGDSFLVLPTRYGARDLSVAIKDVNLIAAASPIRTGAGSGNTGTGTISPGVVTATGTLPTALVTLTYNSGTQTFTTASAHAAWNGLTLPGAGTYTPGATISANGVDFVISGTPANGDQFTIGRNTGGVSDGRNALLLGALQTNNTLSGNTATFQGVYSQLVSSVGNSTHQSKLNSQAQTTLLQQTEQSRDELSGVNLDEEAANLLKYQQAYQAAAKVIQIGSSLLDTILQIN